VIFERDSWRAANLRMILQQGDNAEVQALMLERGSGGGARGQVLHPLTTAAPSSMTSGIASSILSSQRGWVCSIAWRLCRRRQSTGYFTATLLPAILFHDTLRGAGPQQPITLPAPQVRHLFLHRPQIRAYRHVAIVPKRLDLDADVVDADAVTSWSSLRNSWVPTTT
jgi:hypothetical protein